MKTAFKQKTLSGVLAASLFLATPLVSMAGIGNINVRSSLGEPLAAVIPLSGEEAQLAAQQPDSVSVSSQAPIGIRVAENNGNTVLVVRSKAPINQSILIMNVNVGSAQKPYVVLLDPPKVDAQAASSSAKTKTSSSKKGDKTESTTQSNVGSSNVGLGQRYTVVPNDTVISLARQIQTPNVSLKQTMNAIVAKNPHAFIGGDPNKLKNGATITLPTESELKRAPAVIKPKEKAPVADKKETSSVVAEPVQQAPKQEPVVEPKPAPAPAPVVEESVASVEQPAAEIAEETTSEVIILDEASVAAPQEEVVAPQVDKAKTPKTSTVSDSESSDGGLLSLLPYIAGGLILLLLLLWLLTRGKKKPQKSKQNRTKVDDLVTSPNVYAPKKEPVAPVAKEVKEDASNVAVAAAAPVVLEELEDDDDITFNAAEKVQEAASSVSDALSNIDLNLKDSEQEEIEENKFVSNYEEEKSSVGNALDEVVDTVKETASKVTETVQEKFEDAVEAVKEFVDPEVDTTPVFEEVSFENASIVEQPVVPQESVNFVQEEAEAFAEPEEVPDFAEEEFVAAQPESRHAKSVEDQLAEGEKQKLAFDSSINLDLGFGDFSQEATSNEVEDVKKYEPSPLPKLDDNLEFAQQQETVEESVAFVEQPPVADVESYVQEEVSTVAETVAQEESVQEVQEVVARVNENVVKDSDTPLAAKLELAKMYLSMEDNDGAVETLYDILDQAEQSSALYQEAEELLRSVTQTA